MVRGQFLTQMVAQFDTMIDASLDCIYKSRSRRGVQDQMPSPLSLLSHAQSKLGSFLYYTPDIEAMSIRSTSTTSGGSDGLATPESLSPTFSPHDPVALSAAQLSQSRRGMLDLMNKLHSLG